MISRSNKHLVRSKPKLGSAVAAVMVLAGCGSTTVEPSETGSQTSAGETTAVGTTTASNTGSNSAAASSTALTSSSVTSSAATSTPGVSSTAASTTVSTTTLSSPAAPTGDVGTTADSDVATSSAGTGTIGDTATGESTTPNGSNETALTGVEIPGEGCPIGPMAPFDELTEIELLPDPYTMMDGTKVSTKAQWACRHREIRELIEHYETGPKSLKEATVTGSFADNRLTVNVSGGEADVNFSVDISYPSGDGPFPAMIGVGGGSLSNDRLKQLGVATINYNHSGVQPEGNREGGVFPKFHGNPGTGSLMAWAWGVSRIIDALESTPDAKIKPDRLGITGCSRNGKGALMIGAMDSRIALTIPQESGAGGTASWRVSEVENNGEQGDGKGIQNLERTYEEQRWFSADIEQFGRTKQVRTAEGGLNPKLNFLPVDHHELIMMGAPRGMLILGNLNYEWLSTNNANQAAWAARTIYQALGVESNIGYVDSGHGHCGTDYGANEQAAIDGFVQRFLLDDASANTDFWAPKNGSQMDKWVDWEAPASLE